MSAVVIDTNVLICMDSIEVKYQVCARSCIHAVDNAKEGIVVIDSKMYIVGEYRQNISSSDIFVPLKSQMPHFGLFWKWLQVNLFSPNRIEQVDCSHIDFEKYSVFSPGSGLEKFDRSDRKFVVVAMESRNNPKILVATDTDWWIDREPLSRYVEIEFVCEELINEFAEGKQR